MQLVRRSFVFLLAYLAAAVVSSVAVVVLSGLQQSTVVWKAQFELILPVVLMLGLPVAWIPLTAILALTLRLWRSRLLATLCACALTAFALLVWQGSLVDRILSVEVSPTEPPLWRLVQQDLPSIVVVGFLGGLAFWAIAFRGRRAVPAG